MSDAAQNGNLGTQQPLPPTAPNTSSEPASRTLRGAGLKYGDSDPVEDWAKGKTADEVYEIARSLRQQMVSSPPMSAQQPIQQAPPNPGAFSFQAPDPNLALTDYAGYQKQLLAYNEAVGQQTAFNTFRQVAQPFAQNMASISRSQSMQDPKYAKVWSKWGHEIDAVMSQVPIENRTFDAYQLVARHVKGEHTDEIAEERAQQLLSQRGLGTESGAGVVQVGTQTFGDEIDQFLNSDHPKAATYREVGKDGIKNYIKQLGITPKKWVEDVSNGRSFSASGAN